MKWMYYNTYMVNTHLFFIAYFSLKTLFTNKSVGDCSKSTCYCAVKKLYQIWCIWVTYICASYYFTCMKKWHTVIPKQKELCLSSYNCKNSKNKTTQRVRSRCLAMKAMKPPAFATFDISVSMSVITREDLPLQE